MKKIIGIIIAVAVVAAMVLGLALNKKKSQEETRSVAGADATQVVMTQKVQKGTTARTFTSNGVALAVSELNFVSEINGRVVAIYADKGTRVQKGTPLLKIDDELLEADYKASKAAYDALKKDEERFSRSYEAGGISNQQLDNIRTQLIAAESRMKVSKWRYENAVVKAPIAGTINNRFVENGALIAPSVPLFEIVDDSAIKVICNVSESKVRMLKDGMNVTAKLTDGTSDEFTGKIKNIGIKTDRGLNYPVEIRFDRNANLHPGMYLKVSFNAENGDGAIFIPRKAVVGSVLAANVYVAKDGKAIKREVKLGEMADDTIEILEGLEEGEDIIVAGLMNVADGCAISIVGE